MNDERLDAIEHAATQSEDTDCLDCKFASSDIKELVAEIRRLKRLLLRYRKRSKRGQDNNAGE